MSVLIIRCNHLYIRLPGILYSLMIMGKTSTHFNDSLLIFNNYSFNFHLQNLKLFIILLLNHASLTGHFKTRKVTILFRAIRPYVSLSEAKYNDNGQDKCS